MPTYIKTIIYKLFCKNTDIKDCYIGHTTNFKSRKAEHKYACLNENSKSHNLKVYKFIRENGGWDNFDFEIVEEYPCNNKREAEIREHYWYFLLKSTLNEISPILDLENIKRRNEAISLQNKEIADKNRLLREENRCRYLEENKTKIEEHKKQVRIAYNKQNREHINKCMREYNNKRKEKLSQVNKKYYEERKLRGYYDKKEKR
jgi:hypothetical protein